MNCGVAMTIRLAASRVVSDYPQRLPHLFMAKLVSKIPTAIHATRTRFSRAPTSTSLHGGEGKKRWTMTMRRTSTP
ncbi:hypothetical protein JCM18920_3613 [Cutibacterium acnes JCM 18920]|nr:hypothetical protein JCM18918_2349 [Cutibacterium acnes JCM 18918]GAE81808.1 hypothetical protein JCM18920_3613 [Cutibacterium acnes JCM 18920]